MFCRWGGAAPPPTPPLIFIAPHSRARPSSAEQETMQLNQLCLFPRRAPLPFQCRGLSRDMRRHLNSKRGVAKIRSSVPNTHNNRLSARQFEHLTQPLEITLHAEEMDWLCNPIDCSTPQIPAIQSLLMAARGASNVYGNLLAKLQALQVFGHNIHQHVNRSRTSRFLLQRQGTRRWPGIAPCMLICNKLVTVRKHISLID